MGYINSGLAKSELMGFPYFPMRFLAWKNITLTGCVLILLAENTGKN
jgi:hypothetical protein